MKITQATKQVALSKEHHPNFSNPTLLGATALIHASGYKIENKRRTSPFASMTTTDVVTKHVWLAYDWNAREDSRKVTTLYHELVHINQAKAWGNAKFVRRYTSQRWRWAIEMQAYAVSILVARSLGGNVDGMPEAIADTLVKKYGPWITLPKADIRRCTVEVLGGL